jgi:hypothetical protein
MPVPPKVPSGRAAGRIRNSDRGRAKGAQPLDDALHCDAAPAAGAQ